MFMKYFDIFIKDEPLHGNYLPLSQGGVHVRRGVLQAEQEGERQVAAGHATLRRLWAGKEVCYQVQVTG